MIKLFCHIKFFKILFLIITNYVIQIKSESESFQISIDCTHNHSFCNKEELEYFAISELHDQIDDDKNGDIDISESKDFVEESLSNSQGDEKAKKFHKTDAHIDKQDLWQIWKSNEVYNWTTFDLINWLKFEVELPQYETAFTNLKLNGSSLSRLTGMDFLLSVVKIQNSIHRKKIMIKAVDAVLFGSSKRFQITTKAMIATVFVFTSIISYLLIQNIYSKQFVKTMQIKLKDLSNTEENLTELRNKLKEEEDSRKQKDFEIQQLEERHKYEITRAINSSRESLYDDSKSLQEITRLRAALNEAQNQINHLIRKSASFSGNNDVSGDSHQLHLLLQITRAIELQNLGEQIAVIDRQSAEFKELNEKVKKKKNAFLGTFRVIHSSDMDDIEKGFAVTKRAYEKVIYEKKEHEMRWCQLENITGFNLTKIADIQTLRQMLHTHLESIEHQKRECASSPLFMTSNDNIDKSTSLSISDSHGTSKSERSLKSLENAVQFSIESGEHYNRLSSNDSVDSPLSSYHSNEKINDDTNVTQRSRKDHFDRRRHLKSVGKSRIPSLTRSTENSK